MISFRLENHPEHEKMTNTTIILRLHNSQLIFLHFCTLYKKYNEPLVRNELTIFETMKEKRITGRAQSMTSVNFQDEAKAKEMLPTNKDADMIPIASLSPIPSRTSCLG